jgi:tRNA-2-methylthio-N6-dimethylallyladenosine synthase
MSRSFHLVTYGCQMNIHDGERVSGVLQAAGWSVAPDPGAADAVILMTCCVRGSAEDRFWGNLQSMRSLKRGGRPLIAVGGCVAQNEGVEVFTRAPHVDLVFGTQQYPRVVELLEEAASAPVCALEMPGLDLGGLPRAQAEGFRAWVPVIYGCNNFCSYCVVPFTRGREVSRPRSELLEEIGSLVEGGSREVILLGQNVNSYGRDLEGEPGFASLLGEVAARWPDTWIRFLTSPPRDFTPDIVEAIQGHPNICRYIHLPIQAGSDEILLAMNRGYCRDEYLEKVASVRKALPDAAVSSDIIVGYPGETEEDFLQTLGAVRASAYDMAYTYVYNRREGTRAAESGVPEVPREVMMERFDRLAALVRELAYSSNQRDVGKELEVLVDGHSRKADPPRLRGRTRTNKVVNLPGEPELIGSVVRVRVAEAGHWSLQATCL